MTLGGSAVAHAVIRPYRKVAGGATIGRNQAKLGVCAAQKRTPEFREGMAELRELGRTHACAVLCAEAVWWRRHRRTPARFADHVRRFASSGGARHLHA